MTNKEKLKNIIDNDFNKDKNYEKIMTKENTKINYLKFSFIPIFLFVILGFIISNNRISLKKNDIIKHEIENVNQNNCADFTKDDIVEVFTTSSEASWAYNVSDPNSIYENSDYLLKVEVLGIGKGTYQYSSNNMLQTPIFVKTLEILNGNPNDKVDAILQNGGVVTIEEAIKNMTSNQVEKRGWDKLTEEEKKTKYVYFEAPGNYNLEIGQKYVVALKNNSGGQCVMSANGYSVFKIDSSNLISNALTGEKLFLN